MAWTSPSSSEFWGSGFHTVGLAFGYYFTSTARVRSVHGHKHLTNEADERFIASAASTRILNLAVAALPPELSWAARRRSIGFWTVYEHLPVENLDLQDKGKITIRFRPASILFEFEIKIVVPVFSRPRLLAVTRDADDVNSGRLLVPHLPGGLEQVQETEWRCVENKQFDEEVHAIITESSLQPLWHNLKLRRRERVEGVSGDNRNSMDVQDGSMVTKKPSVGKHLDETIERNDRTDPGFGRQ
ncbi:hypothetical protein C8R45DRAFT_938970 [Mycena sanguinolenta]|nr:hypothetical protein C8R45DRAFT_938970 [Mycena sanguinolenta]